MFGLWRKWISYPIWWAVLVGGFAILQAVMAGSAQTYADMESFHGEYRAVRSGNNVAMEVTETISVKLYNERGIVRDLITTYGDTELLHAKFTVTDGDGAPIEFRRSTLGNGDISLRIGDGRMLRGLHTYKISYTTFPVMIGNGNYQELYFNVNGTEWPNGFKRVSAVLEIDDSLAGHLTGEEACYVGEAGSTQTCTMKRDGQRWSADVGRLGPFENLTMAVGFEAGTVDAPMAPYDAASLGWRGIALTVGVGLAALLLALGVRVVVGNLKVGETGVVTRFEPPEDLPPVVAADFLGRPERGAAAHLAWLVTQGHGTLTGTENLQTAPGPGRDDLSLTARDRFRGDIRLEWSRKGVRGEMRRVTELLFGPEGKSTQLGRYRRVSGLFAAQEYRDQILEGRHLRHNLGLGPIILWGGFLALTGLGFLQVWRGLAGLGWWFLLATAVSFVLLMGAVHLMPVHGGLTRSGKKVRRELMGLERFITMAESGRISWLQNAQDAPREDGQVKLYEKLLPWAIVFGEERSWAQLVGSMYDRFPTQQMPTFPALATLSASDHSLFEADRTYYDEHSPQHHRASFWASRSDVGQGPGAQGWKDFVSALGDMSAGRGDDDSSTRGSGRGWGGGSSSSSFSGGSGGGGSSGGGSGGGGGGRW